jgi:2-aminoadipate transaminase
MKASEIRDLFVVASRPDIISFAGGMPETRSFPMEKVIAATKNVMETDGSAALQYIGSEGIPELRDVVVRLMAQDCIDTHPEDIIITGGGQQALDLLAKIFISAGDKILVEAPTYVGAIQAFNSYEADMISIPLDENGIQVDLLEKELKELKAKGERAKFLYVVPDFHNPAGVTLSQDRREKLLALSKEHNLLVLEDNPYNRLRFEGEHIKPLRAQDPSVIYLSTFSKIFSPGVRLGWINAPRPILEKLNLGKQAADLCSSAFAQKIVAEYFKGDFWLNHVNYLAEVYRKRRDAMVAAMEEFFPEEVTWSLPHGGLFLWAQLPEYIDTAEMLAEAISEKVAYITGRAFFPDRSGKNCIRLNFSYPNETEIHTGIKRLAKVIKDQMALYQSVAKKMQLE